MTENTIAAWQKRLDFLLLEQAKAAGAAEKFKLQEDIKEAEETLRKLTASADASGAGGHPWLEKLFAATVCSKISRAVRPYATHSLVSMLRQRVPANGAVLVKAGRFLVEHQLLATESAPYCELTGERQAFFPEGDDELWSAVEKKRYLDPAIPLAPGEFLQRTLERADHWYEYFDALRQCPEPKLDHKDIQTLHSIEVRGKGGAIAPQYLVAGLMSHFHDDWWPVIRGYTSVGDEAGMLERLQASQWICWLVWGPSIPLCKCEQWQPALAYQFGYGDENNSLPIYFKTDPAPVLKLLHEGKHGDRRALQVRKVVGRLAWGPFAFGAPASFAQAQARLTTPPPPSSDRANEHPANGLLMNLEAAEPRQGHPTEPAYFTSYIWLMFWVGKTGSQQTSELGRLNGKPLPAPADASANRQRVRAERLWEDLLPVFVHANIFDPVVLQFQKGMLIENALHLLRRTWKSESQAIEFHLVCTSDYSGCGNEIEFPPPPGESLVELLRSRLAALGDDDAAFANSVCLYDRNEAAQSRSPAFRAFFSACHLPEMIDGYFQYLADKTSE